jgi:hypothetical protein
VARGAGARTPIVTAVATALALVLVAPGLGRAATPAPVYTFQITYEGTCEGLAEGELRFNGSRVELWGQDESGQLQIFGTGPVNADDTFSLSLPEHGFSLTGRVLPQSLTATGTFSGFGANPCPFRLTGEPVETTTTTAGPAVRVTDEEFDPTSTDPLSDGELAWLLRRVGWDQRNIDRFFGVTADMSRGQFSRFTGEGPGAALFASRIAGLATVYRPGSNPAGEDLETAMRERFGRRAFPLLGAMLSANGPLAELAGRGADPEAASAFNRMVRLAITASL